MKKIYICLISLTCTLNTFAQQGYTLEECTNAALQNNVKSRNARLDLQRAAQHKKETFTTYFPSASISGIGFTAHDPILSANIGGTPLHLLDDGLAGAITLTQPLFTGGKITYANKLAKLNVEAGKQQLKLSDNDVILTTEQLYWQLISLYEKQKTLDTLQQQLDTLLKDVQVSFNAGIITQNEVLQVQLKLNDLKSKRINLTNATDLARMALCQKMGIDIESYKQFNIAQPDINSVPSPADIYVNHREALPTRAENILLEQDVQASHLQTRLKRAEHLPTVAVGATYYQQNFMDKWDGNAALFLSVSIPISGWWGGSHAIKQQRINEQVTTNNKTDRQEQLLLQMQQSRNELDDAYKQIVIARESIEQASENLRLNTHYYKAGTVHLTDLLDAQSFLQQNRDKYTEAFSFYQQKRREYLIVTGR